MKYKHYAVISLLSAVSLQAATFVFDVELTPGNTNPDTSANAPVNALGNFSGTYDDVTNTLTYTMSWENLSGPIASPGAHIHGPAALGSNAGVLYFILTGTESGLMNSGTTSGSYRYSEQEEMDLLNELHYVNVHTAANGSGEIRGQITTTLVPEPSVSMLGGLALLGLLRRRRS